MRKNQWDAVATVLRDAGFPANRQDLVNHARVRKVDELTLGLIRRLPVGVYRNLVEVRERAERIPDPA
ncbi:DUF2795 domain-containing protein [Asanoa iriomotensis]|uniref:DUF2795 domain-containing protein n=1 Tax=Asanoa iriomotensis TaxID=234613 RepID=A0ABQ4C1C0_9ACTN|nr:DUF2795 domain-containing protein [Asanoa iriomotensis]GIF56573.1 hypothetical protein Air01nite_26680 [Asanoa iriomotensis]